MKYTILNDLHIGTLRASGTSPQSAKALRQYATDYLAKMLKDIDNDLIILGDLFDGFQVPLSDALVTLKHFTAWLNKGHKLYLVPGNHDLSNDSSKLSTFEFVSSVLAENPNVKYHRGGGWLCENDSIYCISHVYNQDLFDLELDKVPACDYLLLHCNDDNGFAREKDHSLNLSKAQADKSKSKRIVLAHEHIPGLHGKVLKAGNQFPMSISDCLGYTDKRYINLVGGGEYESVSTWDSSEFAEYDWRHVQNSDHKFIRVVGNADESEAAAAIGAIANLRKASSAFVVGSGVRFASSGHEVDIEAALASAEDAREFNLMAALKEILKPEQYKVLEELT